MALFYYNDQASGASNNTDFSDPLNWWQDSEWTIAADTLPGSGDDVVVDSVVYEDSMHVGEQGLPNQSHGGFNSVVVNSTGLICDSVMILTWSFTNNSTFTGSYAEKYYTNGVFDSSINGLYYDSYSPGGYAVFVSGVTNNFFTGGWNGAHYTNGVADSYTGLDADYSFTPKVLDVLFVNGNALLGGWNGVLNSVGPLGGSGGSFAGSYPDYGVDPTGSTYFFFYDGYWLTGSYNSIYYIDGQVDTNFTGIAYDDYVGADNLFINGYATSDYAGWNGTLYYGGLNTGRNGTCWDYGTGDYRYFAYGYWLTGGVSAGHFTDGLPDSYTGPDWDAESNNTLWILFINGAYFTYGPFIWSDGYHGPDYLGLVSDYSANLDGSVQRLVVNQSIVTGFYNGAFYGSSDFAGMAWDYGMGKYLIWWIGGYASDPNNGETPYNSYQVINVPLPSDVRRGVSYFGGSSTGTLDVGTGGSSSGINYAQLLNLPFYVQL